MEPLIKYSLTFVFIVFNIWFWSKIFHINDSVDKEEKTKTEQEIKTKQTTTLRKREEKSETVVEETKMKKTYEVDAVCTNCGENQSEYLEIDFGVDIKTGLADDMCENCGCKGFLAREE